VIRPEAAPPRRPTKHERTAGDELSRGGQHDAELEAALEELGEEPVKRRS